VIQNLCVTLDFVIEGDVLRFSLQIGCFWSLTWLL
jgi:hypothetical protein